jgi:hypothetical protein
MSADVKREGVSYMKMVKNLFLRFGLLLVVFMVFMGCAQSTNPDTFPDSGPDSGPQTSYEWPEAFIGTWEWVNPNSEITFYLVFENTNYTVTWKHSYNNGSIAYALISIDDSSNYEVRVTSGTPYTYKHHIEINANGNLEVVSGGGNINSATYTKKL